MRLKKWVNILGLLALLLALTGCGQSADKEGLSYTAPETLTEEAGGITDEPEMAPDIVQKDIHGKNVDLKAYRGQLVWVHFWSTSCQYCVEEMPDFTAFAKAHEKELKIITINTGDDLPTIKAFEKANNLSLTILQDVDNKLSEAYLVQGYPSTFFVDPNGKIVGFVPEKMKLSEMETALTYLKEHSTK